jgi:hypothetical protein
VAEPSAWGGVPALAIVSLVIDEIVLPWRRGEIRRGAAAEESAGDSQLPPGSE